MNTFRRKKKAKIQEEENSKLKVPKFTYNHVAKGVYTFNPNENKSRNIYKNTNPDPA